jgi:methylenetetrahydrofolate reductase (NADPH)
MDQFKWWYDAIRAAGITLPVDVGVMPVLDSAATINMALSHNACVMPRALCEIISRNWIFPNVFTPGESEEEIRRKKASFMEEGIQYTIAQVNEYLSLGVDGIHLFALNKAEAVSRIIKESNLSALL